MKIAILNVDNLNSASSVSKIEPFADPAPWLGGYSWNRFYISKLKSELQIRKILKEKYDVIINLCDGAADDDRPGIEVVRLLEKSCIPFTGAASDFYDPSRNEMKSACNAAGINSPKGIEMNTLSEVNRLKKMNYPFIVKHPNSYNSIGMTKNSVVYNEKSLINEMQIMLKRYKRVLVEEYIDGPEFTALVAENANQSSVPFVFQPMEIQFPEGETFKHFDLKWKSHATMKYVKVNNPEISDKIKNMTSTMFNVMNGSGYARCDLRMNNSGELFMLEINPNCSIYYPLNDPSSADEILYSENNGHKKFTELILESSFLRCKQRRK